MATLPHRLLDRLCGVDLIMHAGDLDDPVVYVFGHSHKALEKRHNGALIVNPGAVYASGDHVSSMARLHVTSNGVAAEIVLL